MKTCLCLFLQPNEEGAVIDVTDELENSKALKKSNPSEFELLKVLGQGSFGKVMV